MRLEDIGFYTLSDKRARMASSKSPLQRCELLLTDACNFRCPYCRGVMPSIKGELPFEEARNIILYWIKEGLQNVRFTGGEPTLYNPNHLLNLVQLCASSFVKHIAISTNGTADLDFYEMLISHGVNDFSISLDGGCCEVGDKMSGGIKGAWNLVVDNIRALANEAYISVGMVFTLQNIDQCIESVLFADSLGVKDIRVIPSAQYNQALVKLQELPEKILEKYPILQYRIKNMKMKRAIRGLRPTDYNRCPLVLDDMAVAAGYHFPCVIYMREQGQPIGKIGDNTREDREKWFMKHNTYEDDICRRNCLDVCIDYNNTWHNFHKEKDEMPSL